MDMEKLTKQQIVLVTLLVSFFTSIATGIVTVALMDQAPPGVTQTINRVVERTVEKVVTPPTAGNSAAVIARETVIVKEDDKITEAVEKNKNSIARIYTNTSDPSDRIIVGLGTVVRADGLIVTGNIFADTSAKYLITVDGENFYKVKVLDKSDDGHFYFLKVIQDPASPIAFKPATLSKNFDLKLGQSVIGLGGMFRNVVGTGIISSILDAEPKKDKNSTSTVSTKEIAGLTTSVNYNDNLSGGPLLNLDGEVIGIRVSANISPNYNYLPAKILLAEMAGL